MLSPEAIANGLPPIVVPWEPGVKKSDISGLAIIAPQGIPPPRAFASVIMSGLIS